MISKNIKEDYVIDNQYTDEKKYFDYLESIRKENKKTIGFHKVTVINNFYINFPIELKNEITLEKTIKLVPALLQYINNDSKHSNNKIDYKNKYNLLDDIRKNKKIIKIGLEQCGSNIQYLSDELKNDRELATVVITQNANCIQYLSDKLKNDRELAISAITQNANCIQYLSDELKNDRELAHIVVNKNGLNIQYLSKNLKDDKELAFCAIKQNPKSVYLISNNLKCRTDILQIALKNYSLMFNLLNKKTRQNDKIVFYALKNLLLTEESFNYFKYIGVEYLEKFNDKYFMNEFYSNCGYDMIHSIIKYLSDKQKKLCYNFIKNYNIKIGLNKYYNYLKINSIETFNCLKVYWIF